MQHVNQQNWFAVILDFFIVVFGIWLAFQISEWADQRDRRAELVEQLRALNDDFAENVDRLQAHREYTVGKLANIAELRAILSGSAADADMERLDFLLADVFSVRRFAAQLSAYQTLLGSGNLRYLNGTQVHDALSSWQENLAYLDYGEAAQINIRDQVIIGYVIDEYSFAAAAEQALSAPPSMQRSRFRNDFESLKSNRKMDNLFALGTLTRGTVLTGTIRLIDSTESAITTITQYLEQQ